VRVPLALLSFLLITSCGGNTRVSEGDATGGQGGGSDAATLVDASSDVASSDAGAEASCATSCAAACCTGDCVSGRCLVTLASGAFGSAVAVSATTVYWSTGDVMRVSIDGGPSEQVWTGQGNIYASDIAVSPTSVYWATSSDYPVDSDIWSWAFGGTSAVSFAPCYKADSIALNAQRVFWLNGHGDALMAAPLEGGDPEVIVSAIHAHSLVIGPNDAYWLDTTGSVMKVSLTGGTAPTILAQTQALGRALATDATSAYWSDSDGSAESGRIMKVALDGTNPVLIAPTDFVRDISVDSSSIYWVTSSSPNWGDGGIGSVRKLPLDGGPAEILVPDQVPTSIAIDATSVYWTNEDGTVMKLTPR
jgi:hypothetical protein